MNAITESSTEPPAVPPANRVSDAFGKRGRRVGVVKGTLLQAGSVHFTSGRTPDSVWYQLPRMHQSRDAVLGLINAGKLTETNAYDYV